MSKKCYFEEDVKRGKKRIILKSRYKKPMRKGGKGDSVASWRMLQEIELAKLQVILREEWSGVAVIPTKTVVGLE